MFSYFGDSFYQLEHEITIMPQAGGQTYDYYVRCQDPSGNSNVAEYVIRFTTSDEPDLTPPVIEITSIENYAYVAANVNETGLAAYINEPANCKWSLTDQTYNDMGNTFQCSDSPTNALSYTTYPCYTNLNIAEGANIYYFRCEDKSESLNQNQQSYAFNLIKTEELTIESKSPEGTLYDTISPTLQLATAGGAENGKATCHYTHDNTIDTSLWPEFFETDSNLHTQQLLSLAQGSHNYYTTCKDIAGNEASTTISFVIDKDLIPPELEYLYKDTVVLHVILDEPSTCEYNNETFNYGTGIQMQGAGTEHNTVSVTAEDPLYINCEDIYGNHWTNPIITYL